MFRAGETAQCVKSWPCVRLDISLCGLGAFHECLCISRSLIFPQGSRKEPGEESQTASRVAGQPSAAAQNPLLYFIWQSWQMYLIFP